MNMQCNQAATDDGSPLYEGGWWQRVVATCCCDMRGRATVARTLPLLALLHAVIAVEDNKDADLKCSACQLFLETYHSRCATTVFKQPSSPQKVYEKRMRAIFKEKGMSQATTKRLLAELASSPGREHAIYMKLCTRKGVPCEAECARAQRAQLCTANRAINDERAGTARLQVQARRPGRLWGQAGAGGGGT